jgi:hypothetical protein
MIVELVAEPFIGEHVEVYAVGVVERKLHGSMP